MARPVKEGLDYFTLDCCLNDRVKLIEAEFGLKGFAVIVKLYQKIYKERGYYCEWNSDNVLLFLAELGGNSGADKNFIEMVVSASIRRGIFSKKLYDSFSILTSIRIQEQYFDAVSRREKVEVEKEYLLVKVSKNFGFVNKYGVNVDRNSVNDSKNTQSREEKSREENIYNVQYADELFEKLWKLYPEKKGKGRISESKKMELLVLGADKMTKAIERYKHELEQDKEWRKPQNGSTFFNAGYIDYLDENYVPSTKTQKQGNVFNKFEQRDYDYTELEKELLKN